MKHISKIFSIGLLSLSTAVVMPSCSDFLDEGPKTALTEEEIYGNLEYTESTLQATYKRWRNMFTDRFLWECMVGTDEVQSGAYQALKEDGMRRGAIDRFDNLLTSERSYIRDQWEGRWPSIGEAAKIINALKNKVAQDGKAAQLFGEASFIRGGMMMETAMLFGRIPILDLEKVAETGYGRQPLENVWKAILTDLENAAKYCPEKNEVQRATKYAANMLLGYAYMAAPEETGLRDFSKAKDALELVVEGPFVLVDYWDLFDYNIKNTSESIFEWQFSNTWPDNNMVQFQVGSRAVQSMGGDGCFMSGFDHAVPTEWAYSTIEEGGIWEDGDVRKDESLRYDFTWYGQTPTLESIAWEDLGEDHDELKPHIKKYEDFRTDSHSGLGLNNMWYSGKNISFLRLANAKLLYAECLNELDKTDDAIDQVNEVRERAWEFDLPEEYTWKSMGKEEFRKAIMTERVRELFAERWRKFDLIRTGKFYENVKEHNKWAKRSGTIQPWHVVWPIPLSEIDQNEDIDPEDQNEGYR